MVLDTDTYNEVDDQFALAYALLSPDKIDLQAIYAAPFHNDRSENAGDGMEKAMKKSSVCSNSWTNRLIILRFAVPIGIWKTLKHL
ncbi:hypothetical protein MASR2M47_36650 [Draconibacterium sp.]